MIATDYAFHLSFFCCADDDECTMNIHECAINTVCKNTEGSFECECAPGFIKDGEGCVGK